MKPHNVLIDTDIGDDIDDILALAFALLRRELSVKAITTVCYDTLQRCHIIQRLLSCLERSAVPYAPGMKLPLRPATSFELRNAAQAEAHILNQYPVVGQKVQHNPPVDDAIELIARTVTQYAGDITLITIGPLTNIATALCRYPEIRSLISCIAMMGGEMKLNHREHNFAWDAPAANIVFSSGVPIFMGTWEVTQGFVLSPEDCQRIGQHPSPLCRLLDESIKLWWPHKGHKPGPVMYDVAPILWTFAPEYFTTEKMPLAIETRGDHTGGYTVRGPGEANAEVSVAMQSERVREIYLQTLLGAD